MLFSFLLFFVYITINLSQQQVLYDTTLQFRMLNISYPMKTYAGIGAISNNSLYGFNGIYCETNNTLSCESSTTYIQYTLNISSIQLDNESNKIHLTQSTAWIPTQITPTKVNAIHMGTGTSSSTYLNQYVYILHGGCCTQPTGIALKYSLTDTKYINQTKYNSIIPGQNLSDSCNTNDGIKYIYCIGGRNGKLLSVSNKVYRYHILSDIWAELSDLKIARFAASCTFVKKKLYVLGGEGKRIGSRLNAIEMYTNDEWNIIETTLHTERYQHISITHPNQWIITIGGIDENNKPAGTELFNPFTAIIAVTQTIYYRKQFFHAVYEYDTNTYILFLFGGNINGIVFDDVQYIILSKNDDSFSIYTSTMQPTNSSENSVNNEKTSFIFWKINSKTLIIILICVGGVLLIICIVILIFMICARKNNKKQKSRIFSPQMENNCFMSSDSIRRDVINEETQEMNRLITFKRNNRNQVNAQVIESSSDDEGSSTMTSTTVTATTATVTTVTTVSTYKGYSKILEPR
eukprot:426908_1